VPFLFSNHELYIPIHFMHEFTNKLIDETSPYLLQHAHNPVNWYPWSDEALNKAKKEDKPILVSIGYSACHWCHVMERESFEDPETARLMNEHFVNIKIDREERPDLDHIYMDDRKWWLAFKCFSYTWRKAVLWRDLFPTKTSI
jgi:uncharacterized protein YyaL (SSP411 family)